MKQSLLRLGFVTALSLFTAHFSFASSGQKVIYGEDNRVDVYASSDNLLKELSRSTAAQIENSSLSASRTGTILSGDSLRDRGMCASERFSSQITAARCSGFLVGKDLLVTAGHCVTQMGDCAEYSWVFDYKMTDATSINLNIPKSNIYKCTQIISRALDSGVGSDYALVKLDRPVEGREPLKVRKSGKIPNGASIAVIGHPTGLPTKISDGANVRTNNNPKYFVANLDTYGGNSGSAVFNTKTGEVEGILVRGENDYVYDSAQGCRVSNKCTNAGCRGEDVTRITNIKELMSLTADEIE